MPKTTNCIAVDECHLGLAAPPRGISSRLTWLVVRYPVRAAAAAFHLPACLHTRSLFVDDEHDAPILHSALRGGAGGDRVA